MTTLEQKIINGKNRQQKLKAKATDPARIIHHFRHELACMAMLQAIKQQRQNESELCRWVVFVQKLQSEIAYLSLQ